jgi:diguanylate cyclase (GGDEF)-like protein
VGLKCSVLAVDDENYVLHLLTALLGKDFDVLTAESAAQAREILRQRDIDIVITDQYLQPGETGVQLLEWARLAHPNTVRILMTARASIDDVIDAINQGQVHRILLKPLQTDSLLYSLRTMARTVLLERSHEQLLEELRRLNLELEQRVQQRTHQLEEANRQLQYKNSILERMALTDALTGLPNRRAMDRLIRAEFQRRARHPASLTLGIIDIDHFKNVNTQYLLPGGDHVLVWLAQTMNNSIRNIDTIGRIGGEEFMLLAPGTGSEGAFTLAERIRTHVAQSHTVYNGHPIQITVSLGVAVADIDVNVGYDDLKHLASTALSEAKQTGRNKSVVKVAK